MDCSSRAEQQRYVLSMLLVRAAKVCTVYVGHGTIKVRIVNIAKRSNIVYGLS